MLLYSLSVNLAWQIAAIETAQAGFQFIEREQLFIGLLKVGDLLDPEVLQNIGLEISTGCCPNKNPFERILRPFLRKNLGEAKNQRFQLFDPKGRVLKSPGASLRFIKDGLL